MPAPSIAAMKRIAILVAVVTLASCSPSVDKAATGEEIYLELCARCHAADLSGGIGPSLGVGSETDTNPDTFLESAIVHGRGRMPSFGSSLDDDQVQALVRYVREQLSSG